MRRLLPIIIILLLLLPVVFPLFTPFVRGTADGLAHKFRVVSFVRSLREGTLRPRWLADQAMWYGSPMFLFNYLTPYYAIGALILAGISVNTATQIYIALTIISSGLTMYLLARQLWGDKAGIVAAIAYAAAPYHLLAAYVYEGWGEITAFVFPPMILYLSLNFTMLQFHNATKHKTLLEHWNIGTLLHFATLVATWFLFILSHNPSVIMLTPVVVILSILMTRHSRESGNPVIQLNGSRIKCGMTSVILIAFITAVFLSAFFWLPAVTLNHLTNYPTLIAKEALMRPTFFKSIEMIVLTAVDTLRKGNVDFRDFTVGLPILVGVVVVLSHLGYLGYLRLKKKKTFMESMGAVVGLLVIFFISLYLASFSSNWLWDAFPPLNFIVYPFRFLFPATFAGSLLVGYIGRKHLIVMVGFTIFCLMASLPYTRPTIDVFSFSNDYFYQPQTIVYAPGTKMNMATVEFLPTTANREFLQSVEDKYIATRKPGEKFIFTDTAAITEQIIRTEFQSVTFEATRDQLLTINTHAFPNWEAKLDGMFHPLHKDLEGRITTAVPVGKHTLLLHFGKLPIESVADGISLFTLLGLATAIVLPRLQYIWRKRN